MCSAWSAKRIVVVIRFGTFGFLGFFDFLAMTEQHMSAMTEGKERVQNAARMKPDCYYIDTKSTSCRLDVAMSCTAHSAHVNSRDLQVKTAGIGKATQLFVDSPTLHCGGSR